MKRTGNLLEKIAARNNLYEAFYKARKGKLCSKEVLHYQKELEFNLNILQSGIKSGDVAVGNYNYFTIYDPKQRIICAASFEERVFHHALMNVCHQYFDKTLISDSYATRPGKGIYKALEKAGEGCKQFKYVAKLDIKKYFDSINHDYLKSDIRRLFKDPGLLMLFDKIIDSYGGDTNCGLPIGNLTSQYFANLYLSKIDHYIKEILGVPIFVRYMDDMVLFRDSKEDLKKDVSQINKILQNKGLTLKTPIINRCMSGISFLGYKVYPYRMLLEKRSKKRFIKKMKLYTKKLNSNEWTQSSYSNHVTPLISFVNKASSYKFRQSVLKRVIIEGC